MWAYVNSAPAPCSLIILSEHPQQIEKYKSSLLIIFTFTTRGETLSPHHRSTTAARSSTRLRSAYICIAALVNPDMYLSVDLFSIKHRFIPAAHTSARLHYAYIG